MGHWVEKQKVLKSSPKCGHIFNKIWYQGACQDALRWPNKALQHENSSMFVPAFTLVQHPPWLMMLFLDNSYMLDFDTITIALIFPIFHPALQPSSQALVLCAISWLC